MSRLTTEEFIQKVKDIHGDRYDYSQTEYIDAHKKVKIICPEHGVFEQRASSHYVYGCSSCSGHKQSTTKEFIQKAKKVHGDRYDYSLSQYTNANEKLKIICPEHGVFEQKATNHLRGCKCPSCSGNKRLTTGEFIQRAKKVHGNKYNYSQSNFTTVRKKLKIICPRHGVFEQEAGSHLKGCGCPACAKENESKKKRLNTKEFIQRAKKVHGDKYDYSQTKYTTSYGKLKIICPKHGVFEQEAMSHLRECGCPVCARENDSKKKLSNTQEFIEKAKKVHGDKYNYSQSQYINALKKLKIICPSHGAFEQASSIHLRGSGCPSCGMIGFNPTKPAVLYLLKFEKPFVTFWKIGITNKTPRKRFNGELKFVTTQYTWKLDTGVYAKEIERRVLKRFSKYKFDDLFLFPILDSAGETECFASSLPYQKVISFVEQQINSVCQN